MAVLAAGALFGFGLALSTMVRPEVVLGFLRFQDFGLMLVMGGAVVVTTGTFLNGLVHVGRDQRPSGRAGEPPSRDLAESIKSIGFTWGRLKTGTP